MAETDDIQLTIDEKVLPIENSTHAYETVLDPFVGSGTTIIAAEQLDRVCYSMELDPRYCDVVVKRWEEYTGREAEKL